MASVSKHPLLWKPGAASPKPSNKVRCGAGWRALSGDSEAASKRDGVNYFILRLEGQTCRPGWAYEEEGRRGGRTRQILRE